jgi:hypothetical protein
VEAERRKGERRGRNVSGERGREKRKMRRGAGV